MGCARSIPSAQSGRPLLRKGLTPPSNPVYTPVISKTERNTQITDETFTALQYAGPANHIINKQPPHRGLQHQQAPTNTPHNT